MAKSLHSFLPGAQALRRSSCKIAAEIMVGEAFCRVRLYGYPWGVALLLLVLSCLSSEVAHSAEKAVQPVISSATANSAPMIVVGFVGGFVHHDDLRHSEVQLAEKLRAAYPGRVRVATFENWHRTAARRTILQWLDRNEDGELSEAEKQGARIVLYGHSWGGAAAIALARQLQKESIPVLLTIQVDSIAKPGQNDQVIPANVARAVNFYQSRGLLHGRPEIKAADPARTAILGDFFFDYKQAPAECRQYPWLTRHLFPGHTSIECDPQVWSQIEGLISQYSSGESRASVAGLH